MSVLRIKGLQLDFNCSAPMLNSFSILATNEKPLSLVNSDINLPWQFYWEVAYISYIGRRKVISGIWVSSFTLYLQGHFIQYVSICERAKHMMSITLSS